MRMIQICLLIFILAEVLNRDGYSQSVGEKVSLKTECSQTLRVLVDGLVDLQVTSVSDSNFGALHCKHCNVYHTRAAEVVYPFAVVFKQTGDPKYLIAAKHLGNWLIRQQLPEGSWKETPEEWTGTTTDQLLMMACAYPLMRDHLSETEKEHWKFSITGAADYLVNVMNPEFASINYCATTTATLALTHRVIPAEEYLRKASELAIQVISKMDEDGFITGEGGRIRGVKYGVDVGYDLDMSLWGLGLYAHETGDSLVNRYVLNALENHLYFVFPDGSIDGSWGIRSNKWTTYGSQTADGCQILFSLYAHEDARYRTAAFRNLAYLRTMIEDDLVGYGPHYWDLFDITPCIYPTFARSKNLALAVEFGDQTEGLIAPLPTEDVGWTRHFPTVDVVLTRTRNLIASITAYDYKDVKRRDRSKYMYRPSGGSISNLWVQNHGFLQISSQTVYHRWEPMHFPEVKDTVICLTPRIEFTDESGYYTNLYEFDGRISIHRDEQLGAIVSTSGELKDNRQYPGGVAYVWTHTFTDDAIEKSVLLRYHGKKTEVRIIEPIVQQHNMRFQLLNPGAVSIQGGNRDFRLEVVEGDVRLEIGQDESLYWFPLPAVKCYPLILYVDIPKRWFEQEIIYRISVLK
ncbi:MAG: hypothetical protein JSV84_10495 [Gemmatimonadota bacterium]|nr:MAG: hypothetical protein JSV84_10495 [Gemmatimonadota bacterium]